MEFSHIPVMLDECLNGLSIKPNGIYVDCTIGGGGHSLEILKRLDEGGRLIGIDKDSEALEHCRERLIDYKDKLTLVKSDYNNTKEVLNSLGVDKIDGALMDLGVSSYQIDNSMRGFSYSNRESRLDMRMDNEQSLSAYEVVNEYGIEELKRIIRDYGEEKFDRVIAKNIVEARAIKAIEKTGELTDIINRSIPMACRRKGGNPSKRTFQAIRIEVNGELTNLGESVTSIIRSLNVGGRLAVITFHSLEDRIVKQTFKELEKDCICPPSAPICICKKVSEIRIVTNKPILPTEMELSTNQRAASAKLRIAEKK
ncbi:MAG: 16S rRNA (cytosine(1402)-N(4))-methyltransferase RsmH [Clostridia bacterium]